MLVLALDPLALVGIVAEAPDDVEIVVPASSPPNFSAPLWSLLQEIKTAGIPLTGKIAEYAGFYRKKGVAGDAVWDPSTDNGAEPDKKQTGSSQPNKSLDKLTFMIMFHLPFRAAQFNSYYGDPISGPGSSWSAKANALRVSPLHKLNASGEQVDANGNRCNDAGVALDASADGLDTPAAYAYYENIASDLSGAIATVVKSQPLYLYLALITEGRFKIGVGTNDVTLSVVQYPRSIDGLMKGAMDRTPPAVLRRREVELGMYQSGWFPSAVFTPGDQILNFPPYSVEGNFIEKETSGGNDRYFVAQYGPLAPGPKIYLRLKYPAEELAKNGDHSLGATVFELQGLKIASEAIGGTTRYYATYYVNNQTIYRFGFNGTYGSALATSIQDNQFDNMAIVDMSGVTMGWGYDIGQGYRQNYQYNIIFTIWPYVNYAQQPVGTTEFTLRYKDRSVPIDFNATNAKVATALRSLLQLKEKPWPGGPDTITVTSDTNTSDPDYPNGWKVKIVRANMDPGDAKPLAAYSDGSGTDGFMNIYSSNIFYQPDSDNEPIHPNINISPLLEKDRYRVNTSGTAPAAWSTFVAKLNAFFGVPDWKYAAFPGTSAQAAIDRDDFESLLRSCFAIRRGNAFLPVFNQNLFMRRFHLPAPEILFTPWIRSLVMPDYFEPKMASLPATVKDRTNSAEKYVLMTIAYMGNTGSSSDVNEAIRKKSFKKLKALVRNQPGDDRRRDKIQENLEKHFRKKLYRNVEED